MVTNVTMKNPVIENVVTKYFILYNIVLTKIPVS